MNTNIPASNKLLNKQVFNKPVITTSEAESSECLTLLASPYYLDIIFFSIHTYFQRAYLLNGRPNLQAKE